MIYIIQNRTGEEASHKSTGPPWQGAFMDRLLRLGEFQGMFGLCVEDIKRENDKQRTFWEYILKINNSLPFWHFVKIDKELEN